MARARRAAGVAWPVGLRAGVRLWLRRPHPARVRRCRDARADRGHGGHGLVDLRGWTVCAQRPRGDGRGAPAARRASARASTARRALRGGLAARPASPRAAAVRVRDERVEPGEAVRLLEAGGERAEIEMVAAEVLRMLDEGVPAEELVVVLRSTARAAPLVEQVFEQYGIPLAAERKVRFSHTALGRGVVGLARCALLGSDPAHAAARRGPARTTCARRGCSNAPRWPMRSKPMCAESGSRPRRTLASGSGGGSVRSTRCGPPRIRPASWPATRAGCSPRRTAAGRPSSQRRRSSTHARSPRCCGRSMRSPSWAGR